MGWVRHRWAENDQTDAGYDSIVPGHVHQTRYHQLNRHIDVLGIKKVKAAQNGHHKIQTGEKEYEFLPHDLLKNRISRHNLPGVAKLTHSIPFFLRRA